MENASVIIPNVIITHVIEAGTVKRHNLCHRVCPENCSRCAVCGVNNPKLIVAPLLRVSVDDGVTVMTAECSFSCVLQLVGCAPRSFDLIGTRWNIYVVSFTLNDKILFRIECVSAFHSSHIMRSIW